MRLLNSFKSQDDIREAQHVVSCLNNHIHLLLKASKSKINVLKSFKTTLLVWNAGADYEEFDIDVKDISKLNKVIGFGTKLHKFNATNCDLLYVPVLFYHLPSADICFV